MLFDLERVKANVRQATTEDLLDRVTVYRAGMEDTALEVIEDELRARKLSAAEIDTLMNLLAKTKASTRKAVTEREAP